ncbi:MAG: alpha/beta hydrolase, partial [Gloeobacteraceae cyanobacterium ES-bin-316]|nr:alpha/beta hydrolase [Ferruginibacter sp.]
LYVFDTKPATPAIKTIALSTGVTLEYAEQGATDGIPVLLLHGYTDSWHSYEAILPHLPENLHVYAISQRGHGNSSKPLTGYHPTDFANDIAAFIIQQGLQNAVIVGHSMGSSIVQSFAVTYPHLSKAIVLAGSFASYDKPAIAEFKTVIDALSDPVDSAFAAAFQHGTAVRPVPETMMKKFVDETTKVPAYVWKGVAAGWSSSSFLPLLQNYHKPVLIIWGDKDNFCSAEDQQLIKQALKKSTLLIYKETGHALHWEEPERFAQDLVEFVNGLR